MKRLRSVRSKNSRNGRTSARYLCYTCVNIRPMLIGSRFIVRGMSAPTGSKKLPSATSKVLMFQSCVNINSWLQSFLCAGFLANIANEVDSAEFRNLLSSTSVSRVFKVDSLHSFETYRIMSRISLKRKKKMKWSAFGQTETRLIKWDTGVQTPWYPESWY